MTNGTLRQVLECSRNPEGKILTTSPLPLAIDPTDRDKFSSHTTAWAETMDEPLFANEVHMPTSNTRWGHASTCGAFEGFQLVGEGFGLCVDILNGARWWIVARPSPQWPSGLSSVDSFLSHEFLDNGMGDWELEAILLVPGTRL
jgi:hypothetical protein